jgi:TolB protein
MRVAHAFRNGILPAVAALVLGGCRNAGPLESNSSPLMTADVGPTGSGRIAFISNRDGNFEIYTMNEDGSGVVRLTDNSVGDFRPAWSPDGTQIAFSRGNADNSGISIWLMNADGSNQHQLNTAHGGCPAWSPDGTRIAFWSGPAYGEVMVMNADGSGLVNITNTVLYEGCPTWSADGSRIIFPAQLQEPNYHVDLYSVNPDGTDRRLLLGGPGTEAYPDVSPDGSHILYTMNSGAGPGNGGRDGMFVANADGTSALRVSNIGGSEGFGTWSPDGSRIAFAAYTSDWDIFIMNADGTGLVQLTDNHKIWDAQPSWTQRP